MIKHSRKPNKSYIKEKSIIKFIKAHSDKPNLDFSKIKISSFLDSTEDEQDFINNRKKKIIEERKENKMLGKTSFIAFKFPKNNEIIFDSNKNNNESKIMSKLFD